MDDIEEIRRRKMRQMEQRLRAKRLEEEKVEDERRQVEKILAQVLKPDAMTYLDQLRSSSPAVAGKIEEIIIGLVVQRRINYKVDKVIIKAIERKVRGVEPTISFSRKGKRVEISEKLREEE